MTDSTVQPIRPGQVWRRNSDGVEVEVRRVWSNGTTSVRHVDPIRRQRYGPDTVYGERMRKHFTLISDPSESTTPPTREDQP